MKNSVYFAGKSEFLCKIALLLATAGFEQIEHFADADSLVLDLENAFSPKPRVVIIDMELDHHDMFPAELTQEGTRTGVVVYERLREKLPQLPIICFGSGFLEEMQWLHDPNLMVSHHHVFDPAELAQQARAMLDKARKPLQPELFQVPA